MNGSPLRFRTSTNAASASHGEKSCSATECVTVAIQGVLDVPRLRLFDFLRIFGGHSSDLNEHARAVRLLASARRSLSFGSRKEKRRMAGARSATTMSERREGANRMAEAGGRLRLASLDFAEPIRVFWLIAYLGVVARRSRMAEAGGFEPPRPFRVYLFSRQARSTTLARFRRVILPEIRQPAFLRAVVPGAAHSWAVCRAGRRAV